MSLSPGSRFGSCEVIGPLGAGGMGEVYRAHDTSLKRDVALKVLPQAFVDDADRLARFQREAEILASLNHPNIAQVYGLEKADGQTAIVMELVEGPTLADRIEDGPIPPDEAMGIASQVLAALEAAHDKQIVHRDLKPANVKVKDDGTVKVLDFGISKPIDPAAISGGSPVATTPAVTQTGVILGTAAYMSPEQARGRFVDERTDIWAFGCLLFEMLTGQPAFGGEDVMLTLARVLDRDTDLSSIPTTISPAVRHTLKLCLEKDPRQRIADIRDVRLALEGRFETRMPVTDAAVRTPLWRRALPVAAALIIGGLLVGFAAFNRWPAPASPVMARFEHPLQPGQSFRNTGRNVLALSADGARLAYNASDGIYVRELGDLTPRLLLPVTANGFNNLAFAPDGEWVAYWDPGDQQIKKISVSGGSPVRLAVTSTNPTGVSWTDEGSLLFGQPMGIFRLPATGGEPELVIESQGSTYFDPQLLPDGSILYMASDSAGSSIVVEKPGADDRTVLFAGGRAIYLPTGHLVTTDSASPGTLFLRSFDLATRTFGGPAPIQERVAVGANGKALFAVSPSGTLALGKGNTAAVAPEVRLAMIDRMGRVEPLDLPPDQYRGPRVSPDGSQLAVEIVGENDRSSIWIYDLTGQQAFHPLLGAGSNVRPLWTADGTRLFFGSNRDGNWGIYWQAADSSGVAERLTQAEAGVQHWPDSWSPATRTLAFTRLEGDLTTIVDQSIWTVAVDADGRASEPEMLDAGQAGGAAWSPNGRWIAYRSNEESLGATGEIHAQPFPTTGERHVLTDKGGTYPVWSADGDELIYRRVATAPGVNSLTLGRLRVESGASLAWGNETEISVPNGIAFYGYRGFDLMPDGEHLIATITSDSSSGDIRATSPSVEIVTNWFALVKERVPTE